MEDLIFIAGIIQGSIKGREVYPQDYRKRLKELLRRHFPKSRIYCPWENHSDALEYTDEEAKATFLKHIELVKRSRLLVAYLPEASMGTAIEMWEAYKNDVEVWTITPMRHNWVVRITSSRLFESIEELEGFLRSNKKVDNE